MHSEPRVDSQTAAQSGRDTVVASAREPGSAEQGTAAVQQRIDDVRRGYGGEALTLVAGGALLLGLAAGYMAGWKGAEHDRQNIVRFQDDHRFYLDDHEWDQEMTARVDLFGFRMDADRDLPSASRIRVCGERLKELDGLRAEYRRHAGIVQGLMDRAPDRQTRWTLEHRLRHIEQTIDGKMRIIEVVYRAERDRAE